MAEIETLKVEGNRVSIRAGNVVLVFYKRRDGKVRTASRYSYDAALENWVAPSLYSEAAKIAAGILSQREKKRRRIRRKREIQLPLPGINIF